MILHFLFLLFFSFFFWLLIFTFIFFLICMFPLLSYIAENLKFKKDAFNQSYVYMYVRTLICMYGCMYVRMYTGFWIYINIWILAHEEFLQLFFVGVEYLKVTVKIEAITPYARMILLGEGVVITCCWACTSPNCNRIII